MSEHEKVFVDHDYTAVVAQMILTEVKYVLSFQKAVDKEGSPVVVTFEHSFREAASRVALAMDLAREYVESRR